MVQLSTVIRLGLRAKLVGVTLGLLAILTAGALLTVRHYFGQQLRRQAARELQAGANVLASIFERSGSQLLDRGRLLAELPSLREALSKQPQQLEPLLMEVKAVRAANLLWATDAQGIVLASTGEYPPLGENLAQHPSVAAALRGQESLRFDLFTGEWWLLLCLPVKRSGSPELLGTVTLALLVGEAYLARLAELMGCQVGFLWGEHRLWSDGWPDGVRSHVVSQAIMALTRPSQDFTDSHGGRRHLWLARPVTGGIPPIAAGPIALLQIQLDESVIQRTSRAIGWIALLTMGIGALCSAWAIRSITQPIKVLVADSQRIGAGDLAHRSQVLGEDEIAELATSFNHMVGQLQASYNELSLLNQTLEARVEERTRQLEQTQAQLLQAEKLASIGQLAAGVAHELNNPLMVILGNAQMGLRMLARGEQPMETMRGELSELLQALDQEAHRSKTIVSNLLDFSRTKPPAQVASDVQTLLDESLKLVHHQVSLQAIQVVKQYAADLPVITADPGQLKQVFVNVILNAVQAMPQGGTLTLRANASDTHLQIAIADTGVGIPSDQIPKVFDPFFTTKEVGVGTGLGLFVSYGLIQRHQGTIHLTSEVGHGTTVTIQLPRNLPSKP